MNKPSVSGRKQSAHPVDLIERDVSIRTLLDCLALAGSGSGQTVLISGEAGIGKTSLLRALADLRGDARIWWGACDALRTPHPLAPLYDIARSADVSFGTQLRGEGSRAALFESVIGELKQSRTPTIFVIDDAHWADEATMDLMKFLGRRIDGVSCVLAIAYRDDEVTVSHPLRGVIGELPRTSLTRIELARLSPRAVAELARRALQSPKGLYESTAGNPFFVTEVLRSAGTGMPRTIQDLVLGRFAVLSGAAQTVLRLVSVEPRELERWLADVLLPESALAIEECLNTGFLEADEVSLRFRHELARNVVEGTLSTPGARALHDRILRALVEHHADPVSSARLAHHAIQAGDHANILRYAPLAAHEAAQRGAHREATAHYEAALASPGAVDIEERASWFEAYAYECQFTAQLEAAIAARAAAAELHHRAGNVIGEAECLSELALAYMRALRTEEADAASRRAVELLESREPSVALAHAYRIEAHLRMLSRECEAAIAWSAKSIALAERFGARAVHVAALGVLGAATQFVDYEAGCRCLTQAFDLAVGEGLDFMAAVIRNNLGSGSLELFCLREAHEQLRQAAAFARQRDIDSAATYATASLALCEMYLGRWEESEENALDVIEGPDRTVSRVNALAALARVKSRRGEPGAQALLDEASSLVEGSKILQKIGPISAARAEAALLQGDRAGAIDAARSALELAARDGLKWLGGELTYFMRRAGASDIPAAPLAEPFQLQLDDRFREAAAAWASIGCPYEQARALAEGDSVARLEALEIFDRLGALTLAADLRQQLRAAAVRGVPRGMRASTRSNPCDLTERELEVVALLCEGLKNSEIAERLCRSVRTIDHHVAACFAKLDVSTRSEAVAAALRLGVVRHKK